MPNPRGVLTTLLKVGFGVVFALLFQGSIDRERLGLLLGLVILARGIYLWLAWQSPRPGDPRWEWGERQEAIKIWRAERYVGEAAERGGDERGSDEFPDAEIVERIRARPGWREDFARRHAWRSDADIISESLSLCTVLPGAMLLALMLTSPVVAWAGSDRGPVAVALAAGVAFHFAANMMPSSRPRWRIGARGLLLVLVLAPGFLVAQARHPYLLSHGTTQRRLLAERVWQLGYAVEAGRYAGLLIDYAKDLEAENRWADAATVYLRALALDALSAEAHEGMARVHDASGDAESAAEARRMARAIVAGPGFIPGAVWVEEDARPLPVFEWGEAARLRVCLVPMGVVPSDLLDAAGARLADELGVEVYRWTETPPALPAAGRKSSLLGRPQWDPATLARVFFERLRSEATNGKKARGAWQFLIVTDADLYAPDANFVFATSFPVHGVVSFARFGEDGDPRRVERLAKQLAATALKCFGVRQAARPDCVTAYVRSVDELDRKPMRPSAATRTDYLRRVARWEADPRTPPTASD